MPRKDNARTDCPIQGPEGAEHDYVSEPHGGPKSCPKPCLKPGLKPAWFRRLSPSARGSLLVFTGSASISFGPLIIKSVEAGATQAAFYRMFFGGLALLLFCLVKINSFRKAPVGKEAERQSNGGKPLKKLALPGAAALFFGVLAGAAFSGDLFFWHRSIHLAGPGLSTILANFQVFILALAGVLFFGERASLRLFAAVILAFGGLVMLLEVDPASLPPDLARGVAYGLITACFLSVYILSLRQTRRVPRALPLAPNMVIVCFSACLVLGLTLLAESGASSLSPSTLLAPFKLASGRDAALLALYGIGCQALGWLMVSAGLPYVTPGRGGLLLMAEPLFAFIWDVTLLGRPTGPMGYAGALVTIFALYLCLSGKNNKSA